MGTLTHTQLKEALRYDPLTGHFVWRGSRGTNHSIVGRNAGVLNTNGYVYIGLYGRKYYAHRLAIFYMTGLYPSCPVDHINCVRTDNRHANLRLAGKFGNSRNTYKKRTNKSGYKGVHRHSQSGKWRAAITVDGRSISLGLFIHVKDAADAYAKAAEKHHGQFARTD